MEFNSFVFPHGPSSYTTKTFSGNLIFVPRKKYTDESPNRMPRQVIPGKQSKFRPKHYACIPCLYLPYPLGSNKTLLYFHGNSEDLGQVYEMLNYIRNSLLINVAAMEYPTYGIYEAKECTEEQVLQDAQTVYNYFTDHVGIDQDDMLILGRSIGSGPASYLASMHDPAMLIILSGFTSIRAVVKETAGKLLQYIVKDRFNNLANIEKVTCPTLIIHGKVDELISYQQSIELCNACKKRGVKAKLVNPSLMSHIEMDFDDDLIMPLSEFMKECSICVKCQRNSTHGDIIRKNFQI